MHLNWNVSSENSCAASLTWIKCIVFLYCFIHFDRRQFSLFPLCSFSARLIVFSSTDRENKQQNCWVYCFFWKCPVAAFTRSDPSWDNDQCVNVIFVHVLSRIQLHRDISEFPLTSVPVYQLLSEPTFICLCLFKRLSPSAGLWFWSEFCTQLFPVLSLLCRIEDSR